ncbi:Cro/CI family transcriptional regulator [Bosea sp. MMO-172]|uniref:Cro/CI family transcriptional regulator n=1 Tax=Bosea sp. MMO-172 TaxID=3127885 RepID=UPI003015AD51
MSHAALLKAVEAVGGPVSLARHLGISSQAVSQWKRVPPGRALAVEQLSGVSRHDLRPDLYGPAPALSGAVSPSPPEALP